MYTRFNHLMATYPSVSPLSPHYIFSPLPHLILRPAQYRKIIIIIITFSGQLPHRRSCVQVSDRSATILTKLIKKINWKTTSQSRNVRRTRHGNPLDGQILTINDDHPCHSLTIYFHTLPLGVSYPSRPKISLWSHSSRTGGVGSTPPASRAARDDLLFQISGVSSSKLTYIYY